MGSVAAGSGGGDGGEAKAAGGEGAEFAVELRGSGWGLLRFARNDRGDRV